MSRGAGSPPLRDPAGDLVEHLRFLREMGVRELRVRQHAAGAPAPAPTVPAPMAVSPRAAALADLRGKEIGDCRRCRLC
ncbi:MAG TPA: hypothetical protein VE404_00995 [Verrucomicrobiae bacterium]|nr:hypothetical protein [Verrucomicrobiae bacterium]